MSDWPADAIRIRCPNGHDITYWSQFVVKGELRWHVRLSPRWVRDGNTWRRGKRPRKWRIARMPTGATRDELPHDAVWAEDGIHLPAPVSLECPSCRGVKKTPRMP